MDKEYIKFREWAKDSRIELLNVRKPIHNNDINCDDECNEYIFNIYRYLSYKRLKQMLRTNQLAFITPKKWQDPYERKFLNTKIKSQRVYKPKKIFCLCTRNCIDNEEALWKVYSKGDEPMIRIKFNVKNLFEKIHEFAQENNCNVYYSKVSYIRASVINGLANGKDVKKYVKGRTNEKKYISLMSLKRKSFSYEKECRLFIVPMGNKNPLLRKQILQIPIDPSIFERFTISPMEIITKEKQERVSRYIEKYVFNTGINVKIFSSKLYKDIEPLDAIYVL